MVKSQKTSMMILFGSLVTVMLGFGIVIPLMPFYITHFGASGSALGLLMAVYSIMQFIFAPFWGRLSDRVGRKPVLLIGVLGYALAFGLMGFSQSLLMLILARALAGVLSSATLPTAMAYIADITEAKDRSRGVGLMGAAMGLGMIFGPMLGGLMSGVHLPLPQAIQAALQTTTDPETGKLINLSLPFLFSGLLALLALPVIHLLLPESLDKARAGQERAAEQRGSRASQLLGALRGSGGFLFAMAFLLAFALANLEGVLGLYGKDQFNMGPAEIGLLMGALGVFGVIQQGVMIGPLTRRFGEAGVLKGGLLISMLGFLALALLRFKWGMIGSVLVYNLGSSLLNPSVTSLISQQSRPEEQGTAMGINNSFLSLGRSVGPLWAGAAYDIFPTLSFWSGALLQFGGFVLALRMLRTSQSPASALIDEPLQGELGQ
jgi:DHA1 family multidrug resistance protein-like MFS transporter